MEVKKKKIILSGMRPTGKLHLGHYTGALENWVNLQNDYQNYHLVADYHNLTTSLDTSEIDSNTIEMVIDWLACGIDTEKSPVFRQSKIKQHAELYLIFSMLITKARLEKNPTLKEQVRDLNIQSVSYGHLGYPVLQAADILLYKGEVVPVGEDQVPHIEITRHIASIFNENYTGENGKKIFPVPDAMITKFSRLQGLDGKSKMSKSLNNAILLSDDEEIVKSKMKKAYTDPDKLRKGDKGNPDICLVFSYHNKFNSIESAEIRKNCSEGTLGCVDCKNNIAEKISGYFAPVREKRKKYEQNKQLIIDILEKCEKVAREKAEETMTEVRKAMKIG